MPLKTAVALILFNRPHLTEAVFSAIAKAQPSQLFLVADGPKCPSDLERCHQARSVVKRVDWPCEIKTNFSEQNLGCRERIVSGLNWVFSEVDQAIVLEDDCVPHSCFFAFCETLLERDGDDHRVMEIGGANYQFGRFTNGHSYYFSKYAHTYGWATWRRAWRHFDESISTWPHLKQSSQWNLLCNDTKERQYWTTIYDSIFKGELKTSWDYQWQLARWCHEGVSAVPSVNLVSNIGFGRDATHTRWKSNPIANMPTHDIGHIDHPTSITTNEQADRYMFETVFLGSPLRRTYRAAKILWRSLQLN
jgi:hypothetical protein